MFTIAGILADEEPKTPISPNGLYNSSNLNSLAGFQSDFSSTLLSEAEEFTLMFWFNLDSSLTGLFNIIPYREDLGGSSENRFIGIYEDRLVANIANSNFGTTYTEYLTTWNTSQWYHVAVTGSLINSRVRLYIDGLKVSEAIMNYSTRESFGSYLYKSLISIAQFNVYNRELTEAEVAEHYVDIDAQVGVLSYDAMTTAQRSGLIYSTSFIDNISYDGNEFKDKSTSNISLSPQPSLTGQQIYVYTDVATSQIYAVNSAELNGTSQYFESDPIDIISSFSASGTFTIWTKIDPLTTGAGDIIGYSPAVNPPYCYRVAYDRDINLLSFSIWNGAWSSVSHTIDLKDGSWHSVRVSWTGTSVNIYVDASLVTTGIHTVSPPNVSQGQRFWTGNFQAGNNSLFDGGLSMPIVYDRELSSSEGLELYNSGTPKCYEDISSGLKNGVVYAPRLCNYNNNAGQELIDQSVNAITTTNIGSTPFTGTGLSVECST